MSDINITLITGIGRSGTSIIAKLFRESGAFGGVVRPETSWGFCENDKIIQTCVMPYLMKFVLKPKNGRMKNKKGEFRKVPDWKRTKMPFKNDYDFYQPQHFRKLVLGILEREGWDGETPLYFKAPSITLMIPVWQKAFPEANWIIVRRNLPDVVRSALSEKWVNRKGDLDARSFVGRVVPENAINHPMVQVYNKILNKLVEMPDIRTHEISYDEIMAGDFSKVKAGIELCGLEYDEEKLRGFIKPVGDDTRR